MEEKQLTKKEQIELLLNQSKETLKEFEKKGLDMYLNSPNRDLLRKWIKEKLESDIEFFKKRLQETINTS